MQLAVVALTALVPLVIGFLWYNPILFGKAWMVAAGMTEEKIKHTHVIRTFVLTYIFSFCIVFAMQSIVSYESQIQAFLINGKGVWDPKSEIGMLVTNFLGRYGNDLRTFKSGAFNGALAGLMIAVPVHAINALFEQKGFKYIAINSGYWILSFTLTGGIICAFAE